MNADNENQHFISKVLLNRFRNPGQPLCCYQLKSESWELKSVERLCSATGYNQLLVPGMPANNSLEASISRVESLLPRTFKALEAAALLKQSEIPERLLKNMREYCTFLKLSSLFSKASAVVSFVTQLNIELQRGQYSLWRELGTPQETIEAFRKEYAAGGRVIIDAKNVLQLIYRLQFERMLNVSHAEILNADWTIAVSPIDLPISDVGLVQIQLDSYQATLFLLPVAPRLLLEGIVYHAPNQNSQKSTIMGATLTREEADYRFNCICLSSVREIIFTEQYPDVKASLQSARKSGLRFARISNPDLVLAAGTKDADMRYTLKCVSGVEYAKFKESFIMGPEAG